MKKSKKGLSYIDIDNLELAWLGHGKKVEVLALQLPDAIRDLAELEAEQEVLEAKLKQKLRDRPKKYNLKSTANEPVKERMVLFSSHREMVRRVNDAKHKVNLLKGGLKVLDDVKKALEDLVTLQGRSYFATPRMDEDTPRIVRNKIEHEDQKQSFTKKRKNS